MYIYFCELNGNYLCEEKNIRVILLHFLFNEGMKKEISSRCKSTCEKNNRYNLLPHRVIFSTTITSIVLIFSRKCILSHVSWCNSNLATIIRIIRYLTYKNIIIRWMQRATAINSLSAFPRASAQSQYLHCIIYVFLLKLARSIVHYTRTLHVSRLIGHVHMYILDPLHYSSRAYYSSLTREGVFKSQ